MTDQLGFDALLAETDDKSKQQAFARKTAHLPDTMKEAIAFHREQINNHHAAMLDCDFETAIAIREDAHLLAAKLNGGRCGIRANHKAPGCVLAHKCKAKDRDAPLWGQHGSFAMEVRNTSFLVEMRGIFSVGACYMPYLGFSVDAIHTDKPFISETGYRSFLGVSVTPEDGMTPKRFVERVISNHIDTELKGKLLPITLRCSGIK